MNARRLAAVTVTLVGVLISGHPASAAQSTRSNPPNPAPVIRKLPPVNFGGTVAPDQRRRTEGTIRVFHRPAFGTTRTAVKTRTICGLTVIEQSPDLDARILMPPDPRGGAAIQKIEPQACASESTR